MARVVPRREKGPCSSWTPWICPKYENQFSGDDCTIHWVCDNGAYKVDCNAAGASQQCRCIENGGETGQFSATDLCQELPPAQTGPINAGCKWQLAIPSF
jgi:hypothetical protein